MLVTATLLPVTVPFVPLTVATAVLLLVHAPPPDVELKLVFDPEQTFNDPVIVAGLAFTVTGGARQAARTQYICDSRYAGVSPCHNTRCSVYISIAIAAAPRAACRAGV